MRDVSDARRKRALLLTTRLRVGHEFLLVKEKAMDRIVKQILWASPERRGFTLYEIQSEFAAQSGGYQINPPQIRETLRRLQRDRQITAKLTRAGDARYDLTPQARREIDGTREDADRRLTEVVSRRFRAAEAPPSDAYKDPFLECLCDIFSHLSEEYVRVIDGQISREHFFAFPAVASALERAEAQYGDIDHQLFRNAVRSFLRESQPDENAIKWNIAQNYFVIKALGFDPDMPLMFQGVFGEATFYLDTNMVIAALGPRDEHRGSFEALTRACQQLGITLKVLRLTLDELRRWAENQRTLMQHLIPALPPPMRGGVSSALHRLYTEREAEGVTLDDVIAPFLDARETLAAQFRVDVDDSPWFAERRDDPALQPFAEELRDRYELIQRKPKTSSASVHDALLLWWIHKRRQESTPHTWLITADTSLPGCWPPVTDAQAGSLAMTCDAFLQWVSPIWTEAENEVAFAQAFAAMVSGRALPEENVFELEDFLVFRDLEVACRELPIEDVEQCVAYIRDNAPMLDPFQPADRERLGSLMARFFVSPVRRYKTDLADLRRQVHELERVMAIRDARTRLALTLILGLAIEVALLALVLGFGTGANALQKVVNCLPLLALGAPVTLALYGILVGRRRARLLGAPWVDLLRPR